MAGAAVLVALTGGVAHAQVPDYPPCTKKAPSPADLDAAKGAHKAATEFNERGEYDKAIQYWRDAYGFDCTAHRLLINIANAYEKKGDKAAAVVSLETYQQRTGGTDTAIAEKIAHLKASVTAGPAPAASPEPSAAPSAVVAQPVTSPAAPGERPYGAKPWILVAAGGAILVVGAVLMPVGYSGISSAEGACQSHTGCAPDVASQGNTGRIEVGIGWSAVGVGAAAVGGGLIWQFAANKPSSATTGFQTGPFAGVRIAPVVSPKQNGLAISGSF